MKLHRLALAAGALILSCVSAQAACTLSHPAPASPWSSTTRLDTMTSDAVNITGGCIDGVTIGANSPVTINGLIGASVIAAGADNTGASDVSSIVQTMVTAGTHELLFPAGTYKFSSVVTLPTGITTIRCEPGKTTLIASASHAANSLFFAATTSGGQLDVAGCIFDGNMANVGVDSCFIQTTDTNNHLIKFNEFTNNRGPILCFTRANYAKVHYNTFTNTGRWWRSGGPQTINVAVTFNDTPSKADAGTGNEMIGNYASGIEGDLVDAGPVTDFKFLNNTCLGANNGTQPTGFVKVASASTGSGCVYPELGSTRITITGNHIEWMTGNGIDIHCADDFVVTGNTSSNNGGAGIALSGAAAGDTSTCNAAGTAAGISRFTVTGNVTNNNYLAKYGSVDLTTSGATAAGSAVLNFADTTGVSDGMYVFATNVPRGTTVLSHDATTATMSANATGGGVSGGATVTFLNGYGNPPGPNGGIWLDCNSGSTGCTISDFTIAGNVATDSQSTKTQPYGVVVGTNGAVNLTSYRMSESNQLAGNLTAAKLNIRYTDEGSGSNAWVCPPGSSNLASGNFGSMACGFGSTASGVGALALGTGNVASGKYGVGLGKGTADFGFQGFHCYSSGDFDAIGDSQFCYGVLRGSSSNASAVTLTTDTLAASNTNCFSIPTDAVYAITVDISAIDHTATTKAAVWNAWTGIVTRQSTAASTAVTMNTKPTPLTIGTVTGADVAITADTTHACLNISATPPTGNTDVWRAAASVRATIVR